MPASGSRNQYGPAGSKQRIPGRITPTPRPAARPTSVRKPVDITPGTRGGWYTFINSTEGVAPGSRETLDASWDEYQKLYANGGLDPGLFAAAGPGGPGGGGRGGGGGGGGAGLTQQMIDAMARVLGAQGPQISLQQAALPAFQGQSLPAFNAAPYTTALGQIDTAVGADRANIAANQQQLQQTLQSNYSNPYAQAQVTPGATAQVQGQGLMGTVGGTASAAPAQQVNAQNADSQAAFTNLLSVLAAADQQAQNSRMAQVPMDANYAMQGLDATALGLRGGVNTAQAAAQNTWQQAQQEREYQNSLMAQQWQREALQRQQETANQQAQLNYGTNVASQNARLQPILDLIMRSAGTGGLNFESLYRALGIAA